MAQYMLPHHYLIISDGSGQLIAVQVQVYVSNGVEQLLWPKPILFWLIHLHRQTTFD